MKTKVVEEIESHILPSRNVISESHAVYEITSRVFCYTYIACLVRLRGVGPEHRFRKQLRQLEEREPSESHRAAGREKIKTGSRNF
jgi:hypothetical protein